MIQQSSRDDCLSKQQYNVAVSLKQNKATKNLTPRVAWFSCIHWWGEEKIDQNLIYPHASRGRLSFTKWFIYLYFRKQPSSRLVNSTTPAKANCKEHNLCKYICLHFACNKTLERTLLCRIHCTLYSRVECGIFSFDRSEQVN